MKSQTPITLPPTMEVPAEPSLSMLVTIGITVDATGLTV